jgi:hypothetical protein
MLTPPTLLHLSGPSAATAQLVVSIGHRADPVPQSPDSVVYLSRKASTNCTLKPLRLPPLQRAYFTGVTLCLRRRRLCPLRMMKFEARLRNVVVMASR